MKTNSLPRCAGRNRAAATFLLAVAAGCSLQPAYQRPEPAVAANYPSGPAYQAATGAARPAAAIGWRDVLADPRLQRLVDLALENNSDLRLAALNVAQVRAQYRIQRAELFPQISANATGSRARTPGSLTTTGVPETSTTLQVAVAASWEIDFFGRLRSLSDAELQLYFASEQARTAEQILLISEVADQYLTLLAYDDLLALTDRLRTTSREQYQIVQLRFDKGIASELDLRQAQTVVEQADANHAAYVRARAQTENALVLLLGRPIPADLPAGDPLGGQPVLADIPAGLPSDLLTRRPDILQAEANLRAEYANIGAARAAFFPTISLTGDFGTASDSLSGLFKSGSQAWAWGPAMTLPIFQGGRLKASLDVAHIQKDIGIVQYRKAIQTAFREVADGLAARGTYDQQVAALEREVTAQERRLELAEMRYKSGADTYLNVLSAQTDLYDGQQLLVSARLQRLTTLVDLYRALGGGWIERTGDAQRPADAQASTGG